MSKRTRTRSGHLNPTLEKRKRVRRCVNRRRNRFWADILAWTAGLESSVPTKIIIPMGTFRFAMPSSHHNHRRAHS